jgi:hypothetical protein
MEEGKLCFNYATFSGGLALIQLCLKQTMQRLATKPKVLPRFGGKALPYKPQAGW